VISDRPDIIVPVAHLRAIFSTKLPTPNPPFPSLFTDILPTVDPDILASDIQNVEELIVHLELSLARRIPIVTFLTSAIDLAKGSKTNQLFTAYLCLQSFALLYFMDLSELEPLALEFLVKALTFAMTLFPDMSDLFFRSFYYFYYRLSSASNVADLLATANSFLARCDDPPPKYFVPVVLDVTVYVLSIELPEHTVADHFAFAAGFFSREPLHTPENSQQVTEIYDHVLPIVGSADGVGDFGRSAILLGIELNRLTSVPFRQLVAVIEGMIEDCDIDDLEDGFAEEFPIEGKVLDRLDVDVMQPFQPPEIPRFVQRPDVLDLLSKASEAAQFSLLSTFLKTESLELKFVMFVISFLTLPQFAKTAASLLGDQTASIFFADIIFRRKGTIFDGAAIVRLRKFAMDCFWSLFAKAPKRVFANVLESFSKLPTHFIEFFWLSAQYLEGNANESIFLALSHGFHVLQFVVRDESVPHRFEAVGLALQCIKNLFKRPDFLVCFSASPSAIVLLLNLLNDSTFVGVAEQLFRKLLDFANETKNFDIFGAISKAVLEAKDLTAVLTLFLDVVRESESQFVLVFCESPFFTTVQNYLTEQEDIKSMKLPLSVLECASSFSIVSQATIDWTKVAQRLCEVKIDDWIYADVRVIISGNSSGFRNPSVVPLIEPMLLSRYALQFMSWCSQLITSNCVQRLELFQFGVIKFLLHFLRSHECSEEISEAILLLSMQTLSFACDRESFE
jgi:hypothetical protein